MLAEKFITKFFTGLKCYIDVNKQGPDAVRASDVFSTTRKGNFTVNDWLFSNHDNFRLMIEALTAPTAHREYDYERLEFYGDSVITFMVILELFLTKDHSYKEGDLDFYRIKTISNMNFTRINQLHGFYQYIISEPQKIFAEFTPGGFDENFYHNKFKQKYWNELNNKIKYLKQQKFFLQQAELRQEDERITDFY